MRSFNIESITALLEDNKFSVDYCDNIDLYSFSRSIRTKFLAYVKNRVKKRLNRTTDANYRLKPHLVAIVSK